MFVSGATEIDFVNLENRQTISATVSLARRKLETLRNPYAGNKRKLVHKIFTLLEEESIEYKNVLDLFCGTASFSYVARCLGKGVWANDLLYFAYYHACLLTGMAPISDRCIGEVEKRYLLGNQNQSKGNLVEQNYCPLYFTEAEAKMLDNYRANAADLSVLKQQHALLAILHYVMSYCYCGGRLYRGQVLAQGKYRIENKKGEMNFSQQEIPFYNHMLEEGRIGEVCVATRLDAMKLLEGDVECDLCYIDPPYGGAQSHYSSMYEFFEEYITQGHKNYAKEDTHRFREGKSYAENFTCMLGLLQKVKHLVLSYNSESWASIEEIEDILRQTGRIVKTKGVDYSYQYRNDRSPSQEYIIIASK